eukprot:gene9192-10152_t
MTTVGRETLLSSLWASQTSYLYHRQVIYHLQRLHLSRLELSTTRDIVSPSDNCQTQALALDSINERFLLSGSCNGSLALYDFHKTSQVGEKKRKKQQREVFVPIHYSNQQRGLISSLAWFPNDCGLFVASDLGGNIALYDTENFHPVVNLSFPTKKVYSIRFNQHNTNLTAVAVSDGNIRLWDILTDRATHMIHAHSDAVTTVDWHPHHEHQLLSSSLDGCVKLWDIRKAGHSTPILNLDWRSDNTYVAEKYYDLLPNHSRATHHPRYHHSANHSVVERGKAHDAEVMSARFTPSGAHILSAGNDSKVRLWTETGRLLPVNYDINSRMSLPFRLEIVGIGRNKEEFLFFPDSSPIRDYKGHVAGMVGRIAITPVLTNNSELFRTLSGHFAEINAIVYRSQCQQLISAAKDKLILVWEAPPSDSWADEERMFDMARGANLSAQVDHDTNNNDDSHDVRSYRPPTRRRRLSQQTSSMFNVGMTESLPIAGEQSTRSNYTALSSASTADAGSSEPRQTRRLFVPPIVRQYIEEARKAQKRSLTSEIQNTEESFRQPSLQNNQNEIDWQGVDSLLSIIRDDNPMNSTS